MLVRSYLRPNQPDQLGPLLFAPPSPSRSIPTQKVRFSLPLYIHLAETSSCWVTLERFVLTCLWRTICAFLKCVRRLLLTLFLSLWRTVAELSSPESAPREMNNEDVQEKVVLETTYVPSVVDLPTFQEALKHSKEAKYEKSDAPVIESECVSVDDMSMFRPRITVVGIGGGGCNSVNNMIKGRKLSGVEFLVCNTDVQSLESNLCENRLQLGENATDGFGAGSNPEVGRTAAQESIQPIISRLHGSHMVFLVCGLGGGTGTGAAPVIASACRNEGILTVAIVTMPFDFEGKRTQELALTGLQKLQNQVDTVIVVPNQKLLNDQQKEMPLLEAFGVVDDVLFKGIQGVTDLIIHPGLVNTDFSDLKRVMQSNSGRGFMCTGEAEGENRAKVAALAALEHPLLDVDISAARHVLVTITASSQCTMQEIDTISTIIHDRVNVEALIITGVTIAKEMGNKIRVSVIATDMASSYDSSSSASSSSSSKGGFFRGWF